MSFFDQPYYALTKAHVCRIGVWPEQPKYVRIIWPLTTLAFMLTLMGPMMKFMLEKIEGHWKMFKNTSGVVVLDEYAERERYVTKIYTICVYTLMGFFLVIILSPTILDFVDPLNETRSKYYMFETDYGVDSDKYYWFICAHGYIVAIVAINVLVGAETMYLLFVVHACGLFELVGFRLKLVTSKYMLDKKNDVAVLNDYNYKKICDCINVHNEAISFAELIERIYCDFGVVIMFFATVLITVTALETLLNIGRPDALIQTVSFNLGQVINLYLTSIPGQKMIDHSRKIHTLAYDLDWYDLPVKAQKLLILILMRSNKPCQLTAGKVYILSMKSFGASFILVLFLTCLSPVGRAYSLTPHEFREN